MIRELDGTFVRHRHYFFAGGVDETVESALLHQRAAVAIPPELADVVVLRGDHLLAGAIDKPLEPEYLHHCPAGPVFVKRLYVRVFRICDHGPVCVLETVEAVALELLQAMIRSRRGRARRCGQW